MSDTDNTAVLEAVARAIWHDSHRGAPCPTTAIPTRETLRDWLTQCPENALHEANRRLATVYDDTGATWVILATPPSRDGAAPTPLDLRASLIDRIGLQTFHSIAEVHQMWSDLPEQAQPPHPLGPLVSAWQTQPRQVEPERRRDKRILPRIEIIESRPARQAGQLFANMYDKRHGKAPELPLWPDVAPAKRVPILDIVDSAGVPVMASGRGAPLPLRLFVRVLASVRPADRRQRNVWIALTLGELRDGLFPHGWRIGQHWPALREALIHAHTYAIYDGRNEWRPVAVRQIPRTPNLKALVMIDVAFPPGSHSGPSVLLPEMDALSVQSASRWRAYIAAHSLAWRPGTTRVPTSTNSKRYTWSRNPLTYPILTLADRRRLAFGAGDTKHRTKAEIDAAFRDLPGLCVVTETARNDRTGEVGWLVLPDEAATAIHDGSNR